MWKKINIVFTPDMNLLVNAMQTIIVYSLFAQTAVFFTVLQR